MTRYEVEICNSYDGSSKDRYWYCEVIKYETINQDPLIEIDVYWKTIPGKYKTQSQARAAVIEWCKKDYNESNYE